MRFDRWDGPRGRGQLLHLHPRAGRADDPEARALEADAVAEVAALLTQARSELPPREGDALALAAALALRGRFSPGGNEGGHAVIAAALGTTRHAVKSLLWRARDHLRAAQPEAQKDA